MSRVARLGLLLIAATATGCLYPSLRTVTGTTDAAGGAISVDASMTGAGGNSGMPDAPGVQLDVAPVGPGGVIATGGSPVVGGAAAAGGTTNGGGVTSAGGTTSLGGLTGTGGLPNVAGVTGSGGAGGSSRSGGATGMGGSSSTGGATGAGGTGGALTPIWVERGNLPAYSAMALSADATKIVAAVNNGHLFTSTDSGTTWLQRDVSRQWFSVASSADGTKLVAAYMSGIDTSKDSGLTWTMNANPVNPDYPIAATSSADGTKLAIAFNASCILTSTDSGVTWTQRTVFHSGTLYYSENFKSIASSTDGTKLIAAGNNIWTSADSGATWTIGPSANWTSVASSADGTKLVAAIEGGYIYTSADSGATWSMRASSQRWVSVASSSDGRRLVAATYSDNAYNNLSGYIYTSTDSGVSWKQEGTPQDWWSVASSADGMNLVAATAGGHFYTSSRSTVAVHRISPRPFLQFPASVAHRFCHEMTALQPSPLARRCHRSLTWCSGPSTFANGKQRHLSTQYEVRSTRRERLWPWIGGFGNA